MWLFELEREWVMEPGARYLNDCVWCEKEAEHETRLVFMVPPIRLRKKAELIFIRTFPGDDTSHSAISAEYATWMANYIFIFKRVWGGNYNLSLNRKVWKAFAQPNKQIIMLI